MAQVINLWGPSFYECDLCENYTDRVVTDSHTQKDICFDCASSGGEGGLFYRVTQSPREDGGDNLMALAKEYGLLPEPEFEDEDAEALV